MLKATKLTKYYEDQTVLNRLTFNIDRNNKIALTGFNGSGKTTLINILAGIESYSNGTLEYDKKTKIGFIPQDTKNYSEINVLDYLKKEVGKDDDEFLRKIEIMFSGFVLPTETKEKNIGDLSSGQKTKVFLTALLLKKPDLILLDEPTNNLDLPALIWLEDYLKKVDAACVIVSHDREFLDGVANKIFEIDWFDHKLTSSKAKYSDYLKEKELQRKSLKKEHSLQKEEVKRLKNTAQNFQEKGLVGSKWKSGDNDKMLMGHKRNKASKSFTAAKVTYGRMKRMNVVDKPKDRKSLSMNIDENSSTKGEEKNKDITLNNVLCGYKEDGNKKDFSVGPISLDIKYGKKICLLGANGVGKSTILKTITGLIPEISGGRIIGEGVVFGNFMQEHELLPMNKTPLNFLLENFDPESEEDIEMINNLLENYNFSEYSINSPIKNMSSGERAKLLFAYFSSININTLILDEPTNHLDMEAEEALEEALNNFEGTIITVTHDRRLTSKINFDNLYIVSEEEGGIKEIPEFKIYVKEMEKRSAKLLRILGK